MSPDNLTEKEIDQEKRSTANTEVEKLATDLGEKLTTQKDKDKLKKQPILHIEKNDITRKSNKSHGTVIMNVNPLKHHMDLVDKLDNKKVPSSNNVIKEKDKSKKSETSKNLSTKFDIKNHK